MAANADSTSAILSAWYPMYVKTESYPLIRIHLLWTENVQNRIQRRN